MHRYEVLLEQSNFHQKPHVQKPALHPLNLAETSRDGFVQVLWGIDSFFSKDFGLQTKFCKSVYHFKKDRFTP